MSQPLVGLEITPAQLKLVELKQKGKALSIQRCGTSNLMPNFLKPSLHSLGFDAAKSAAELANLYEQSGIKQTTLCLTIPSSCARIFFLSFEEISPEKKDMHELIRWRIGKDLPSGGPSLAISYQVTGENSEGGYSVMAVVTSNKLVAECNALAGAVHKKVVRLELDFLSSYNFFEERLRSLSDYLFVYSGYSSTSLLFFQQGRPVFHHRLELGLSDYLASIARLKQISLAHARQLSERETFFVASQAQTSPDSLKNFSLIKEVNERLFKQIYDSMRYFSNLKPRHKLDQVLLCGEGLAWRNLPEFAATFLEADCQWLCAGLKDKSGANQNELTAALGSIIGGLTE